VSAVPPHPFEAKFSWDSVWRGKGQKVRLFPMDRKPKGRSRPGFLFEDSGALQSGLHGSGERVVLWGLRWCGRHFGPELCRPLREKLHLAKKRATLFGLTGLRQTNLTRVG
jgi:hypothetical protein